jgi:hypothetical protein
MYVHEGVGKMQTATIAKDFLIPPKIATSNAKYCEILQISYELVVEAEMPGCRRNFKIAVPITIGSIPLNFDSKKNNENIYLDLSKISLIEK